MEPTLSYKDFLIESNCSSCISDSTKQKLRDVCVNDIHSEASEYHDDEDQEHTYDGYIKECVSYITEMLGNAGYSDSSKQPIN